MNVLRFIKSRSILSIALSVILSFAFIALATNASTTISTNISTGGTLTVTGATGMTGALVVGGDVSLSGGDLNIGDGTASTTITGTSDGYLGLASSTPWGGLSIESESLSGGAPMFVIGDAGTSTPMLIIDGNSGNVGVATTSSQDVLNVGGDIFAGSAATTTITMDSTGTDSQGGCLQMRGSDGTLYRVYLVATTTASHSAENVVWQIEAGTCQ
jgi:hypothetical protein